MNAPWISDMRFYEEFDAMEQKYYAIEKLAEHIAGDPLTLTTAIAELDEDSDIMLTLTTALSEIWRNGAQATPEQSLVLATAVQGIADDYAKALFEDE